MTRYYFILLTFLSLNITFAQPANDNCENAEILCPGLTTAGNTTDATLENCATLGGCADDFPNFGITSNNSVWYKFTTNSAGGTVDINFSNLSFNPDPNKGQSLQAILFEVPVPCQGEDFNQMSAPETNGTANFTINSFALTANTTYYLLTTGSLSGGATEGADASFSIDISGPAIDSPTLPTSAFSISDTDLCQGDNEPITLDTLNCSPLVSMHWLYNGVLIKDSTGFNTAELVEDGNLQLVVQCGNNCIYSDTSTATAFTVTPISVNAGPDQLVQLGESTILEGSGTSNPVWSPETNLTSTQTFTPTVTPTETTTYFLTVTNNTCVLTDEVTIKVKENIIVPSGFTPNNDGTNDIWEIQYISDYPNNTVKIYDRSGQLVFNTTGYTIVDNNWNGTFRDKELPTGTYFYVIDLRNGDKDAVFKGPVTIIR